MSGGACSQHHKTKIDWGVTGLRGFCDRVLLEFLVWFDDPSDGETLMHFSLQETHSTSKMIIVLLCFLAQSSGYYIYFLYVLYRGG
jgi:hypothetical protein